MKLRFLTSLLLLGLPAASASAATVLTNASGTPTISQLVRGPGGFLSQPIGMGFEFTVSHPDDWALLTISFNLTSISGAAPLQVELYGSPTGPNAATLISPLNAPGFFTAGTNTWTAPTPINLDSGETYFVRVFTTGINSNYGLARTAELVTGDWTLGSHYTQAAANPWSVSGSDTPKFSITAVPEPSVLAALAGCVGVLLLVRRRTLRAD